MRFDPAADPWGTAMLAAAALWLLSLLVVVAALVARTSRRTGGWLMVVALLAFLGAAGGGTWVRIQQAERIAAQPPPPPPETIVAKTPPPDPDDGPGSGETGGATGGDGGPVGEAGTVGTEAGSGATVGTAADDDGSGTGGTDGTPDALAASTGDGATGDDGAADGDGEPEAPPPIVKIPERVVPQSLPRVEPLPDEPQARAAAIRDILEDARRAAGGGSRCGNLERVAEAWARLRTIPVDRKAKAIAADLEKCRRKLLYSVSRRHRADRVEARDAYFETLRERMRDEHGLVVQAAISGLSHERLRIGNPELDAVKANALMDGGLRAELMALEFARVVLSNGKKTTVFELEVPPESELGLPDLRAVGLGEPLVLGQ